MGRDQRRESAPSVRAFEPPHLLFTQEQRGGVGGSFPLDYSVLCAAVWSLLLHARQKLAFGRSIASELVSDDHARDILESFEEFPEEALGCFLGSRRLCDSHIEHIAILIHRSPEGVSFATDGQEDARPAATCRHSAGDDDATHWRRSARI